MRVRLVLEVLVPVLGVGLAAFGPQVEVGTLVFELEG